MIIKATAETIPESEKTLVDMLSDMIFDEAQYKEKLQSNPKAKPDRTDVVPEYYERIIDQLARNVYRLHTLECVLLLLESYLPYDADLRRGDTFIHRMTQFGQIEIVKYMLDMGADPDCRTAVTHPDFPCNYSLNCLLNK